MYKVVQLKQTPKEYEIYPRVAASMLKQTKSFLPNIEVRLQQNTITQEMAQSYNSLCGFQDASYISSTYLHVFSFNVQLYLLSMFEMPFPLLGMVHLSNAIKLHVPVKYDEPFTLICRTGNLIAHKKGQAIEINTYIEVGSIRAFEETSVYLLKTNKEGVGNILEWEFAEVSVNCKKTTWNMDTNLGFQYAKASGDFNPIHLHSLSAKLFGFKQHIIHGMYTISKVLAQYPEMIATPHEFTVSFKTPIFLPNKVIFRQQEQTSGRIDFDVVSLNEQQPHVKGYLR